MDWNRDITVITFTEDDKKGVAAHKLYKRFGFRIVDDAFIDQDDNTRCKMALTSQINRKGASFHYNYKMYSKWAQVKACPVCNKQKAPITPVLIKELKHSWVECNKRAQGSLFGKLHVLSKVHSEHLYDMTDNDTNNFMKDVKCVAKALHKVTGAVKINYEIHGNSMPHLHAHLFPRYLDDDFPSLPIDYTKHEPSPYENDIEFEWFVNRMRELI